MIRTIDQFKLEKAKSEKVDIKIGDYLNQSFSIYGKHWQEFSLFAFVSGLIYVLSIITIVGPYLVMYPLQMGYGNVVDKIQKGENFEFNDFFVGFKKWTNFITFFLIMIAIGLSIMIPYFIILGGFGMLMEENNIAAPIFGLSMFIIFPLFMIITFVLAVVFYLTPYLIYHGNMGAIDSIKTSIAIAKKNFWYLLLFVLLVSIFSQIGVYACFIGILASMPIGCIMGYLMIKDMLLNDGNNEIDSIGQSQEL
ncbi:DUF2189 domain-containing protein [Faecalibacter bovis]|uniref:DUF4013 domain-containing protein n=1 Tax=Faecalibacter bovis TaxID=2898187 RepID=A0ABX7XG38_9FLAO|nr:hypothetical protein [Faecalibacter bovis]QTV06927.1 hypothetical protein J9309_06375 [Faecalibacter bovis]